MRLKIIALLMALLCLSVYIAEQKGLILTEFVLPLTMGMAWNFGGMLNEIIKIDKRKNDEQKRNS